VSSVRRSSFASHDHEAKGRMPSPRASMQQGSWRRGFSRRRLTSSTFRGKSLSAAISRTHASKASGPRRRDSSTGTLANCTGLPNMTRCWPGPSSRSPISQIRRPRSSGLRSLDGFGRAARRILRHGAPLRQRKTCPSNLLIRAARSAGRRRPAQGPLPRHLANAQERPCASHAIASMAPRASAAQSACCEPGISARRITQVTRSSINR
jgi:hypothetical protein